MLFHSLCKVSIGFDGIGFGGTCWNGGTKKLQGGGGFTMDDAMGTANFDTVG